MEYLFLAAVFLIAFLYASVGHGGASGYLALMAIFGIEQYTMKSSALCLNLFVAGVSFLTFLKNGYFKLKILLPFIIGSVPMAFIGSSLKINSHIYKIILGIFLLTAVSRLFFSPKGYFENTKTPKFCIAVLTGSVIGFLSGIIGIGGGIILSPLLLLMHWADVKETAGISALFIFLNSTAGLIGLYSEQLFNPSPDIFIWAFIGLVGGSLGGLISSRKISQNNLKYLLASVILIAGIKLFIF